MEQGAERQGRRTHPHPGMVGSAVGAVRCCELGGPAAGGPSDNAESSYQAWAAPKRASMMLVRLSADSEYWKSIAAFNANPDPTSTVAQKEPRTGDVGRCPRKRRGRPEFTYYLDVSGAAEDGRIQVTSSGRAREGDSVVRTVDVLITKRLSTDYAYLSNSESFPHDLPGAYGQDDSNDGRSTTSPAVARELCSTGGNGEEPTYWYQWKPWPGNDAGGPKTASDIDNPDSIAYGGSHRNSYACLHSVVTTDNGSGNDKGITVFDGPAHTNDVWYIDEDDVTNNRIDGVFNEGHLLLPRQRDPEARWIGSKTSRSLAKSGRRRPRHVHRERVRHQRELQEPSLESNIFTHTGMPSGSAAA